MNSDYWLDWCAAIDIVHLTMKGRGNCISPDSVWGPYERIEKCTVVLCRPAMEASKSPTKLTLVG